MDQELMNIQILTPSKTSGLVPLWCSQVPTETDLWDEVSGVRKSLGDYCVCEHELYKTMYGSRNKYSQMYSQQQTLNYYPAVGVGKAKTSEE